ncbi:MAG TPA: CoA-binding protein [Deltaproteobacteria bacterium]|nr:CoA-binding protein [Deltaproteobacteria bacterium]HQJ07387.1 CoA-binding protein [Deltaproteobacteria bacterium]
MSLKDLFYPRSIAVIGASPSLGGGKLPYYHIIKMAGYKGNLYPVNPKYQDIQGTKVYASLDEIPEPIDFAIAQVPAKLALETVEAAARNKVKFLHFFTSGFSEVGNKGLEEELLKAARKGGTRIVGPNCIGVHCTESGIWCDMPKSPMSGVGDVAFLGQSGGMTHSFMRMAHSRYIGLNKVVSYGNQIDLKVEDYLEYFAGDDAIKAVAAYIEDIKNFGRFMEALRITTPRKPVIILKGGVTSQGAQAAASHTGALAVRNDLWSSMLRQFGGIEARTFEELVDLTMMAVADRLPLGNRIGFLGAGGGTSVLVTDFAYQHGLVLPELEREAQEIISRKISNVNTSTTNPVDLGFYGFDFYVMAHTIEAMAKDDNIDVIIPYFSLDFITSFQSDQVESGPDVIIAAMQKTHKPVIPILSRFTENIIEVEKVRIKLTEKFRKAGLAVFTTPQDCIASISKILWWNMFRNQVLPAAEPERVFAAAAAKGSIP